jgi:hypothetical protein
MQVPAGAEQTIVLGKGKFTCTDISQKIPALFVAAFDPKVKVINDQKVVQKNFNDDIRKRAAEVVASRDMQQAYALYESGESDRAYSLAKETVEKLDALGYADEAQVQRYQENLQRMDPKNAAAPSSVAGKDFLKKQKAEERKVQQNEQQ